MSIFYFLNFRFTLKNKKKTKKIIVSNSLSIFNINKINKFKKKQ